MWKKTQINNKENTNQNHNSSENDYYENNKITSAGQDVEEREFLHTVGGNVK
jgi:hypothetical protein